MDSTAEAEEQAFLGKIQAPPYLRHTLSGDVITVHNKAWNDTAGTAMWADVILGPYQVRRAAEGASLPLTQWQLWTKCDEHKMLVRQLPPRMTSVLQIWIWSSTDLLKQPSARLVAMI